MAVTLRWQLFVSVLYVLKNIKATVNTYKPSGMYKAV